MENQAVALPKIFSLGFWRIVAKGIGQVMFQDNVWTGLFFLAGIFYGSYATGTPAVAWGAVVGVIVSTLTGYVLNYPAAKGLAGLWGFNGVLVGCALPTFLGNVPLMWLALVIFSAATTWVMVGLNHLLAPYKVSSFTFPFVLLTWFVLLAARTMHGLPHAGLGAPELPGNFSSAVDLSFVSLVMYWLRGISQVFLVNSWVTGLLFLIGLAISNRWAAIWAAIGSALALAFAVLYQSNGSDIASGLFGFSPVLTGIALGITFYQVNWRTFLWSLAGIIVTVFIQAAMDTFFGPFGIPTLTGPFCVATWLFLLPHLNLDKKTLQQG
ncbi:urea transporter [Odoribacter lunatus]|uniref:urea transporter n=1 Tax=Odoribacter lunatus TaxID=2941335 RepID=UPI00203AC51A|nr:urea transporter [Odoribacter lunatus]